MTKRGRQNILFTNAPGGPRLVEKDDTINLAIETSDGKSANFRNISRAQAEKIRAIATQGDAPLSFKNDFTHHGTASHKGIFDSLVNDMPATIDDQSRIRGLLFQARHFVLDPDACQFITKLAANKELLAELREFALPPFDKIAMTHFYGPDHAGYPRASFDGRPAAFQSLTLWDNGEWRLFVAHEDGSSLAAIPGWTRNLPDGTVENSLGGKKWEYNVGDDAERQRTIGSLALHRTLIDAFFLLLIQTRTYQVIFNDARRSLHRGRPVRYFARSEIKIDLAQPPVFRRAFYTGAHATPRWHEVRRHFVHRGGDRACTHAWTPLESEDGKKRWACEHCDRRRTERYYPNGRGDASRGFVRQKYEITASDH